MGSDHTNTFLFINLWYCLNLKKSTVIVGKLKKNCGVFPYLIIKISFKTKAPVARFLVTALNCWILLVEVIWHKFKKWDYNTITKIFENLAVSRFITKTFCSYIQTWYTLMYTYNYNVDDNDNERQTMTTVILTMTMTMILCNGIYLWLLESNTHTHRQWQQHSLNTRDYCWYKT